MQRIASIVAVCLLSVLAVSSGSAQIARPWWASAEFGDGQFKLSSDQRTGHRGATFAMGFAGGHRLGNQVRVGGEVNGWLLQAFNLNDPTVGESVSNLMGIVDVFPVRKAGFFVRGGAGLAMYTINRPEGSGGNGFAWTAGAGYEIPVTSIVAVAPMAGYAAGSIGDGYNGMVRETGRRYSVVEIKAVVVFRFGRPR